MHKVHMHAGAIRQLLYGCVYLRKIIHSLKLVDYPPVHTHKSYNNLHLYNGVRFATLTTATTLVQMDCSFLCLRVRYEFGFRKENVLRVNVGYLKKVMSHKL